jgi:midasin (ATPase involved in ribosome maturation)
MANGLYIFFAMQLGAGSQARVLEAIADHNLNGPATAPQLPLAAGQTSLFGHPIDVGSADIAQTDYILTPTVTRHLENLSKVVIDPRYAILLEGPTSCGKTSMVEYLANITGHQFVRINNH